MRRNLPSYLGLLAVLVVFAGCGKKEDAPTGTTAQAAPEDAAAAPADGNWTPEALEELLAPIAIYPDVVLGHVLTASTNPQEVLDAGNWLIEHPDLAGSALDDEAGKLGLSPSVRALVQFPEVMDMMCMQMDWTTQLGQAFTADQGAVLDAVQRLRAQAKDVGNLESSAQLKVETESQDGKEIITVDPPSPDVVYVPKYDPAAVYAPAPATIPPPTTINVSGAGTTTVTTSGTTTTVAPATTTATAESKGHSTGTLVTTGLLAFGAGLLVAEVFDDDDDWDDYHPNYYHGGMYYGGRPYYPPPPYMYRPPYGNGYYPAHNYTRPPNYQHGFNNNTIIVNNGGNKYWNNYGKNSASPHARQANSPITAAKPNRNDLNNLNRKPEAATRQASQAPARQSGYAGARPENQAARERMVAKSPPPGVAKDLPTRPRTEYAGATNRPAGAQGRPNTAQRPTAKPATREAPAPRPAASADRGRQQAASGSSSRPSTAPASRSAAPQPNAAPQRHDSTAFGSAGTQSGRAESKASERGRGSASGSGHKARKPRH